MGRREDSRRRTGLLGPFGANRRVVCRRGRRRKVMGRVPRVRELARPRKEARLTGFRQELTVRGDLLDKDGRMVRIQRRTIRFGHVQVPMYRR